jgi:Ca2+-transporting ATPase
MNQLHSQEIQELVRSLDVNTDKGLSDQEAAQRLSKYGRNSLVEEGQIRFLSIFREEVTEPMILLLIAVGVLYSILGSLTDALTIIVVIIILVLAEVWNEYRAKRSISALRQLAPPTAIVLRNGQPKEVQTAFLVPGDILLLKLGQRVPADSRLLEAYGLEADESSLTGESFPVSKNDSAVLPSETRITDQTNMLFAGTIIIRGRAKAVVAATGVNTEIGKVAGIVKAAKESKTTLQLAMKQLSKTLVWIALFFSILIPVLSYCRGLQTNPGEAVLYGLSLAFVVIPEELPIIITMVLGVGSYALSRKGAVVKRLRAAEALGNVTVIATDKTGTITENKMKIGHFYFDGTIRQAGDFRENEKSALKTALLASDAVRNVTNNMVLTNPMSQAILECIRQDGIDKNISNNWILKNELSFDVKRKLASYVYQNGDALVVLSSGAPEKILANSIKILVNGEETPFSDNSRNEVERTITRMAQSGERLLSFGYHRLQANSAFDEQNLERNIVFVGILGFSDPPRKEVKGAIRICQEAGIRVMMITGDHAETAGTIASEVGINSAIVLTGDIISKMTDDDLKNALRYINVFARVTPEDKLRIVRLLKENGEIVAVTGDGINDAPALKEAHIGISMGIRGTDVAKETADMILTDDNFATIETAVKEGRKLYSNLKKGVRYYLACKIALVSIFIVPIILGIPLPFAPIQIIVLELFMDLAASATFVAEPEEAGIMKKPPNARDEKFMNKNMLTVIALGAVSLFAAVTATYLFTWYQNPISSALQHAQTVAFATWMLGHILLALNLRSDKEPLLKLGILSNRVMLLWALIVIATLLVGTNVTGIANSLKITALTLADWAIVVIAAFTATFWIELRKILQKNT